MTFDEDLLDPKEAFLKYLEKWGTVGTACEKSGIPTKMVHEFRRKKAFREREDLAMEIFRGSLIKAAVKRGRDGWEEPVIYQGKKKYEIDPWTKDIICDSDGLPLPLTVRKYDRTLLIKAVEYFFPESKADVSVLPDQIDIRILPPKDVTATNKCPQ